jgi:sulfite exporter TauE/SafE
MSAAVATAETAALCLTAGSVGAMHTILGPDHYVPFVAMAQAGGWSTAKTLRVTLACGLGHLAGSVVLGISGLALGLAATRFEPVEAVRGAVAGWLLIVGGLTVLGWGCWRAAMRGDAGASADGAAAVSVWAPWAAFLVFAFGPCEPLVPLVMLPAARASGWGVAAVIAAFGAATLATMVAAVWAMRHGVGLVRAPRLTRFADILAGLAILACGVLVQFGL